MSSNISLVAEWLDDGTSPAKTTAQDFKDWAKQFPSNASDKGQYSTGIYYQDENIDPLVHKVVNGTASDDDFHRLASFANDVARPPMVNFSSKDKDDTLDRTLTDADAEAVAEKVVDKINNPEPEVDDNGNPIDPATGAPLDPATGMPMADPNAAMMQQQGTMPQAGVPMTDPNAAMMQQQGMMPQAGMSMADPNAAMMQQQGMPMTDPNAAMMQQQGMMPQAGMPMADPNAAMMQQQQQGMIDPATGMPIDPMTGMPMVDPEQQKRDIIAQMQATFPAPSVVSGQAAGAMLSGQQNSQMVAFSVLDMFPAEVLGDKDKFKMVSFCMNKMGLSSQDVADFANIKLGIDNQIINFSKGKVAIKNIIETTLGTK